LIDQFALDVIHPPFTELFPRRICSRPVSSANSPGSAHSLLVRTCRFHWYDERADAFRTTFRKVCCERGNRFNRNRLRTQSKPGSTTDWRWWARNPFNAETWRRKEFQPRM